MLFFVIYDKVMNNVLYYVTCKFTVCDSSVKQRHIRKKDMQRCCHCRRYEIHVFYKVNTTRKGTSKKVIKI